MLCSWGRGHLHTSREKSFIIILLLCVCVVVYIQLNWGGYRSSPKGCFFFFVSLNVGKHLLLLFAPSRPPTAAGLSLCICVCVCMCAYIVHIQIDVLYIYVGLLLNILPHLSLYCDTTPKDQERKTRIPSVCRPNSLCCSSMRTDRYLK